MVGNKKIFDSTKLSENTELPFFEEVRKVILFLEIPTLFFWIPIFRNPTPEFGSDNCDFFLVKLHNNPEYACPLKSFKTWPKVC